jgi:hypothetical protein
LHFDAALSERLDDDEVEVRSPDVADTQPPMTLEDFLKFWAAIPPALLPWAVVKAADKLYSQGFEDLAKLAVAGQRRDILRQALKEKPERSAYIPARWLEPQREEALTS